MTHHQHATTITDQEAHLTELALGLADPAVPMRACCCPAMPMVKVMMPPTAARKDPVDLWLCGHHYRASRQALAVAGARAYWLTRRDSEPSATASRAAHLAPR